MYILVYHVTSINLAVGYSASSSTRQIFVDVCTCISNEVVAIFRASLTC